MMLDATDMHVLCGATEIVFKWRELTRGDENTVIVGGEPILWPDQQRFDGRPLARSTGPYRSPCPQAARSNGSTVASCWARPTPCYGSCNACVAALRGSPTRALLT